MTITRNYLWGGKARSKTVVLDAASSPIRLDELAANINNYFISNAQSAVHFRTIQTLILFVLGNCDDGRMNPSESQRHVSMTFGGSGRPLFG